MKSTMHDRFIAEDYARLRLSGITTVREGIRWHLIQRLGPLGFSTVVPFIEASQRANIQIVWDLFHFGWPDQLQIFSSEWIEEFCRLAEEFAKLLDAYGEQDPLIVPLNEISFFAWAGGDRKYLNPFEENRGAELKRHLVKAWIAAARRIRGILPGARIVSAEPVIHIAGDPAKPGDVEAAEAYRQSMFEAWDMITGRAEPELGGSESDLDIIGVNFYDRNEWFNFGRTIRRTDPEYRPFSEILLEVYRRYRRPMFVSETGTEDEARPEWFAYIMDETRHAISLGASVHGVCLYPILNHPGWDDNRHCYNGLWDYASETGEREIYTPLADEIRRQQALMQGDQYA